MDQIWWFLLPNGPQSMQARGPGLALLRPSERLLLGKTPATFCKPEGRSLEGGKLELRSIRILDRRDSGCGASHNSMPSKPHQISIDDRKIDAERRHSRCGPCEAREAVARRRAIMA